ncbi:DUF4870 domain-containing protein [Clostridium gasigenes]|uniref:Uncharacterized membrane protein n=1 Tax=Clostridium gasigenes TaxID=94869 RepID=A0A1H0VIT9_9CLOT|nr:DUF4870 domain-containing protein [Clostridium gasigenes]MBU3090019.1 DUF4870 domain-containing protein [Clostridium gasigenes]MBU3132370.1 DUF4870 domain-containing protein [Clostridium gasigenes]NKF05734.1 DUF4870 domain-containing protein [Clostridium gasigenes]QSW19167.1 DUF4870 domain-containing protein [Clostridium gasigenes]SDP78263.1 Uncharacterized membrane protein [Clostridium gasigenes]
MENKFEPHKSSLGLDANIVVLIAYLGGIIVSFIPGISFLAFAVPVIIYFVEKDSKFVKFHAMQGVLLTVVGVIFSIIISILVGIFVGLVLFSSAVGAVSVLSITSIFALIVPVIMFIFMIIATVKGWNYECYEMPVIGKLASKIVFK